MSIEKNTKNTLIHEEFGFTTLINETLCLIKNTSALGVYCYLASKPTNWNICKKHLQNHFDCGREHIDSCFKYLKKVGAIEIIMVRNDKGQSDGWETVLKRKIPVQSQTEKQEKTQETQNTGNPYSGDLSTIRETQNTGFPESGFPAPSNKGNFLSNKKSFKKNRDVIVFSSKEDIKNRILKIASARNQKIVDDIVDQITFWIGGDYVSESVLMKINVALKLYREGKWKIPSGYKGITTQSIKKNEEIYESKKQLQQQEDAAQVRLIKKHVLSNVGANAINDMLRKTRGSFVNETGLPAQAV